MRGGLVNLKGLEVHPASGANLYSLTAPPSAALAGKRVTRFTRSFLPLCRSGFLNCEGSPEVHQRTTSLHSKAILIPLWGLAASKPDRTGRPPATHETEHE
jgi:hypothetical protein